MLPPAADAPIRGAGQDICGQTAMLQVEHATVEQHHESCNDELYIGIHADNCGQIKLSGWLPTRDFPHPTFGT